MGHLDWPPIIGQSLEQALLSMLEHLKFNVTLGA